MLGDYLRSFWRGVLHNKVATLINVGGLALGLAVFFALSFYVYREFSWDAHWEGADRIYLASGAIESAGGNAPAFMGPGPYVLGTHLQTQYPDAFDAYVRVYQTYGAVVVDDEEFPFGNRFHAEPTVLDLLQFETLEGSLQEVFTDPRAVAISAREAERLFGEVSPLGKTVTFKGQTGFGPSMPAADFVIRAVFRLPEPTTFQVQFLALLEPTALPATSSRLDLWQTLPPTTPPPPNQVYTPEQPLNVMHYFKLREGVDVAALQNELRAFMDKNRFMDSGLSKTRFVFRNIRDLHLSPSPFQPGDNVQRLRVYAAIGVLVLLISGCNFVMLATLRLVDRMREVGIRKSAGGGTGQLLALYLLDAFIHTLLAAVLAVVFLALAFPKLSVMLELPLQLDIVTPRNLGLCLLMVAVFTLTSSLYPAWVSSQAKPGPLLRNGAGAVVGTGTALRKLLVGIQFAIVVVLLLATAVVHEQIDYTRNRDPGYSLENVVQVRVSTIEVFPRIAAIVTAFNQVDGVEIAANGGSGPGTIVVAPPTMVRRMQDDGSVREAGLQRTNASAGYFGVMSIRVLAGREFSAQLDAPPDTGPSGAAAAPPDPGAQLPEARVILNEAAVRQLGFADPASALEQLLESDSSGQDRQVRKQSMRVIGVVADTQLASVMLPPPALVYFYSGSSGFIAAKLRPGAEREAVVEGLRAAWDSVVPGSEFTPLDNAQSSAFQLGREEFEARIVTGSTLLAIVIALLGLYGLVAATVVKRVKEIGVRKVMGAERKAIVTLFLWQFSKPIAAANLVAWPLGFWGITQWLQRFPYRLDLSLIVLSGLGASLLALAIAWLTVGLMAAKAASVQPVHALRYE